VKQRQTPRQVLEAGSASTVRRRAGARSVVLHAQDEARGADSGGDVHHTSRRPSRDAVQHRVLDEWLQRERRDMCPLRVLGNIESVAQALAETSALDLEIGIDDSKLVAERHAIAACAHERVAQDLRQPMHRALGEIRVVTYQAAYRVENIE
jgi:hypothetical protein